MFLLVNIIVKFWVIQPCTVKAAQKSNASCKEDIPEIMTFFHGNYGIYIWSYLWPFVFCLLVNKR